jgi:hypothetical protein
MTRKIIGAFLICLLCACSGREDDHLGDHLNSQVQQRLSEIRSAELKEPRIKERVMEVDKKVNEFVLLSKDIENLSASVALANSYFDSLSHEFDLNSSDFTDLNTEMHVDEIAIVLKENELGFLNHVLMSQASGQPRVFTAH